MRSGVSLAFGFALLFAVGAGAAPAAKAPPPQPGAVAFWNAERGLIGTGLALCPGACGKGVIKTTTDGGKTWKLSLHTADAVVQLDTAGRGAAWAVTERCATLACRSSVLRTTNSGRSWATVASGLSAVSFATPKAGLGLRSTVNTSSVYRSDNGGQSWHTIANPCKGLAPSAATVSLVTARHGFIVCTGNPAGTAENKSVFETKDGGHSWTRKSRAVLGGTEPTTLPVVGFVASVAFNPSGFGALCQGANVLMVSTNAGNTWSSTRVIRPRLDTCIAAATAPSRIFAIVQTRFRNRLVVSANGGGKWRVVKRF
jgi:photosystem II stability/assembly factor-like uncharacterized protein